MSLAGLEVTGSGASYSLDLSTVTRAGGDFLLALNAAGVVDSGGLPLAVNAEDAFHINQPPFRNLGDALNVDGVGGIVGLDALLVVNEINNRLFSDPVTGTILIPAPTAQFPYFPDTSGDGFITAIDAPLIFNWLNAHPAPGPSGEGEAAGRATQDLAADDPSYWDAALLSWTDDWATPLGRRSLPQQPVQL